MPLSISHFQTRVRTEPDWIIKGWLKRQNTAFILGEPKRACKSWLLLNLAWDLSEGKPIWGVKHSKEGFIFVPPRPMRTVYFMQEDTEDDAHDRLLCCFKGGRTCNDNLWLVPKNLKIRVDDPAGLNLIQNELDSVVQNAGPIDLVMFDPMRRMHYKSENDSDVIAGLWRTLDGIHQRYNCATLFAHHIIKPTGDTSKWFDKTSPFIARGSGDIYGGGDAFANVVPKALRGQTRQHRGLEIHFESKRGKPLSPIFLRVHFETGSVEFRNFVVGREPNEPEDDPIPVM